MYFYSSSGLMWFPQIGFEYLGITVLISIPPNILVFIQSYKQLFSKCLLHWIMLSQKIDHKGANLLLWFTTDNGHSIMSKYCPFHSPLSLLILLNRDDKRYEMYVPQILYLSLVSISSIIPSIRKHHLMVSLYSPHISFEMIHIPQLPWELNPFSLLILYWY